MEFGSLFVAASMPVLQFLLIGLLGAFLASGYFNILSDSARRDINKVVFYVFTPSLVFVSLAETVTLQHIISWWYMPVNMGITYLIGGLLGWAAVKILKPERHLEGLVIANCTAGNFGNLLLIIVPAICDEVGNPFGEPSICHANALTYVSISLALGAFFIWTHTYSLMRQSGILYHKIRIDHRPPEIFSAEVNDDAHIVKITCEGPSIQESTKSEHENMTPLLSNDKLSGNDMSIFTKFNRVLHQVVKELSSPPTIAAVVGLIIGVIPWFKSLLIGATAPLRVIQDSITLLGDGTLPCITLILGGNLTQGLRKSMLKPSMVIVIILVRYVILPIAGIGVIMAVGELGVIPKDPMFRYVLLMQFTVPPAMAIGTMTQMFDVAKEECSIIFLWTHLAAIVSLTVWPAVFMWLLS